MRKKLGKINNQRKSFRGKSERYGLKKAFKGAPIKTVLLKDIEDAQTGDIVSDHVWFTLTKRFEEIVLEKGVILEFQARVSEYFKGYVNHYRGIDDRVIDYKLNYPTQITVVGDIK